VGTDLTWFGGSLPDQEERQKIQAALFDHSIRAAMAGADLVVWNEVSTFIDQKDEKSFIERASEIAAGHQIHLVMAYIVPLKLDPLQVENKYTWVGPNGNVLDIYLKHKPVPGEPSIPGNGDAMAVETELGKMTGAICFDIDYPQVGLDRARKGADIVFVPSSDSPGVDPFHTQIAALRAIEGGYSVVRSTRMGLSAGIDPKGRIRGWLSTNETEERTLFVTIPNRSTWTLYSVVGDVLAYICIAYILVLLALRIGKRI